MTLGLCFWILMLLWLVLGVLRGASISTPEGRLYLGGHVLVFFLFLILGIHAFGGPIKP